MRIKTAALAGLAVLLLAAGCGSSPRPRHTVTPPVVTPLQQAMLKAEICLSEQPDIPGTAGVGTPITAAWLLAHPAAGTVRWVECAQPAGTVKPLLECLAPALRRQGVTRQALPADVRALANCITGAPQ
jgi:hypothetical protein